MSTDQATKANSKSRGTLDGGPYRCDLHKDPFITSDPNQWEKHKLDDSELIHTQSGGLKCVMCNNMGEYENEPYSTNFICPTCRGKLISQFNTQQEKQQSKQQGVSKSKK